ncbi:PAS domain S-box protein [Wenzhouxiangella sp. XN79A]|uniref:PAS domain-containing protein n=1 Tax=Wenzhouxiangella sp. XN79A TaxID=2724193 RepID=UPI00144AF734|nr:PAS domain S-box protein [Wenzhouxiangella sp. XN79A]NKI34784.1 PAS domain S-box protein [Wenzhouxiangella sp. XN79A]
MSNDSLTIASPLFTALAERSFDSVMVTRASDPEDASTIVFVNDAFSELTGYGRNEVLGRTPGFLQGEDTDTEVLERLEQDLAADRPFHGKAVNYRKDGSRFTMEWTVQRVAEIGGEIFYVAVQREAPASA